ncbi:MAG: extracellular solute-binding protein [Armatimonadia bacterium]
MRLRYCLVLACLLLAGWTAAAPDQASDGKLFRISVTSRYNAQNRQPQIIREFLAAHPNVRLVQWDGIKMPAEGSRASLAMAMAANIGPDIFETDIRQAVEQRLAYPLTEWIGEDGVLANGKPKLNKQGKRDLNGQIDSDETKWADWMKIKPLYRQVVTVNGKAYALPNRGGTYVGILYSKTLLRKAGLDPMHPPKTYDEFIRWVRLLYDPVKKTYGLELTSQSWAFAPWVATTGSSIVVQDRKCTACGKTVTFNEQATQFVCPCGEDVSRVVPTWRCNVASPECTAAVAFYYRLRWAPWIMDRSTHEPVELTKQDVDNGYVMFRGKRIVFSPDDVVEGSIGVTTTALTDTLKRLGRDLAMYPLWAGDMTEFQNLGIPPDDLGMMPFPGMNSSCRPVLQASNSFFMIGKDVLRRGGDTPQEKKAYRDLVWDMMRRICSPEGSDEDIRRKVAAGQAKFLNPRDLERLGFKDYLREMPPENLQMWQQIEAGKLLEVVEPFMGKWLQFRDFYQREVIDLVLRPSGKEFDYNTALKDLERDANTGIMFERPREVLDQYRPKARIIAAFIALFLAFFTVLIIRDQMKRTESKAGVYKGWLPWLMLLPAVASIALWGYYPLARGLVMAFQDYKVVGRSPFVGLSNFISIALDPNFYHYLFTTFRFVLWNLGLAFCTPIILAFFLTEVPRFKVFFRTLFFLPQMTSGLVVTLMWKEMYAGTAQGTINRLLAPILGMWDLKPVDWLGNPHTVMACVILPSVWAAAGIGSLIYLAALKSVPEELYEAANIDGATILGRIRHITLPTIAPLVLINFVGAFIGTFQSMGQIFLLTFGGPGKETMVMGMAIWQEAYVNMRFSLATSYAWILGSILIGFTYMQLRILRRVDFRQAKGD